LQDRVTVELRDMYDLQGRFDKIACVGIMEHAGIAHYPRYFRKLYSLLSDRGILLNQAIMRGAKAAKRRFLRRRPEHRFILKYIFPGADLGHIGNVLEVMEQSHFLIHDVEGWREHYALTCKAWARNLYDNRQSAERLVGAETVRLWEAYMAGFSHCFAKGSLRLFQVVAAKRAGVGAPVLPASRADLYARPFPSQTASTQERAA
jgi:cyclopropane-fatty-acyl-phospholipid synthase